MDYKQYLAEWHDLLARNPEEVYYRDKSGDFYTVEDRRHSVAGIFDLESWVIPPSMRKYFD